MESHKAIRVIGRLAEKTSPIFRYAATRNMPMLCVESAVNVIDCMCSFYRLCNERERTQILANNQQREREALGRSIEHYENDTQEILLHESELAEQALEKLKNDLQVEYASFCEDMELASSRAKASADVEREKSKHLRTLLENLEKVRVHLDKERKARFEKGHWEMTEEMAEKYRLFLTSYTALTRRSV